MRVPFAVAEMVFDSATVELSVPVVRPLLLVGAGCGMVLLLPVAERTTVAALLAWPLVSFIVIVMIAVPFAVAETVFASATVEPSVPVATPLTLVVPLGWVSVLPLPVAESATVAPLTGLPLSSFTVTVIVDVPLPAVSEVGDALSVD